MKEPSRVQISATKVTDRRRSEQTRLGIKAARKRGVVWGSGAKELAGRNRLAALQFAESLRPRIVDLMVRGLRRPAWLARELNELNIMTPKGRRWYPATVKRLIKRLGPSLKTEVELARKAQGKRSWTELVMSASTADTFPK